jgi:hypothetical protein
MFISSSVIIWWFNTKIQLNLEVPGQTKDEWMMRLFNNYRVEHLFKFQEFFSAQITCLILRIAFLLQYNENIGPLLKIVGKMTKDFYNFFLLYLLLTLMFAVVGNINFPTENRDFKDLVSSIL